MKPKEEGTMNTMWKQVSYDADTEYNDSMVEDILSKEEERTTLEEAIERLTYLHEKYGNLDMISHDTKKNPYFILYSYSKDGTRKPVVSVI